MDLADPKNKETVENMEGSCTLVGERTKVLKGLKDAHIQDPEGKGLRSERVVELAVECAKAVDTGKIGVPIEIPKWAILGVCTPKWMKEINQTPGKSVFESKSLYADMANMVKQCQERLEKSARYSSLLLTSCCCRTCSAGVGLGHPHLRGGVKMSTQTS